MSATLGEQIRDQLDTIRGLYKQLLEMTKQCAEEFSFGMLERTVRERSLVLLRIDSEEAALQRLGEGSSWSGYDQARDIRNHLTAIAGFDRALTSRLSRRMSEIGRELSSLSVTSNAAQAYTRHIRR